MQVIGIIRDRGQLTIPDPVRKMVNWLDVSSVVLITVKNSNELILSPHQSVLEKEWDRIFVLIEKAREVHGKSRESSSEFLQRVRSAK